MMTNERYRLVRSDQGDGGWSLHHQHASDDEIANGDAPPILSGEATWDEDNQRWDRPDANDYAAARQKEEE